MCIQVPGGSAARLLLAAGTVGLLWGVWALSSAVTDRETAELAVEHGGSAEVLDPAAFAAYAAWVGVLLVAAHLLLGWLWPERGWRPSRTGLITIGVVCAALGSVMVLPVVPWAPLKLAVLGSGSWWLLRSRREAFDPAGPTVLDQLGGRTRLGDLVPVAALPVVAAGTYALLWPLRDADAMSTVFWGLVVVQVSVGAVALAWAAFRAVRPSQRMVAGPQPRCSARVGATAKPSAS